MQCKQATLLPTDAQSKMHRNKAKQTENRTNKGKIVLLAQAALLPSHLLPPWHHLLHPECHSGDPRCQLTLSWAKCQCWLLHITEVRVTLAASLCLVCLLLSSQLSAGLGANCQIKTQDKLLGKLLMQLCCCGTTVCRSFSLELLHACIKQSVCLDSSCIPLMMLSSVTCTARTAHVLIMPPKTGLVDTTQNLGHTLIALQLACVSEMASLKWLTLLC